MTFMWEALLILFVGFCLLRVAGKKTVSEMTGLEIITLLSIASVIGHAVSEGGLWETIVTICIFVSLLITVQYLAIKFNLIEKIFMGHATLVIQDGKIIPKNLKKLRMSVDQLETRLREKGLSSISDVKSATIEINGSLGYELMRHAKPVTVSELEQLLAKLPFHLQLQKPTPQDNLFDEIVNHSHQKEISPDLQ